MESDRDLKTLHDMVQAMCGDQDSLGRVLERYRVRLAAVVIAAGAYRDVHDIVQDAMLKIVTAVRQGKVDLRSVEQFRGWAHTVARNCAFDALRRQKRQPRRMGSVFGGDSEAGGGGVDGIDPRGSTPSLHARGREEFDALRKQYEERCERIAELRQPDQMLVWMRERDGLEFAAITAEFVEALGVNVGVDALRMRYTRLVKEKLGPAIGELPESWSDVRGE